MGHLSREGLSTMKNVIEDEKEENWLYFSLGCVSDITHEMVSICLFWSTHGEPDVMSFFINFDYSGYYWDSHPSQQHAGLQHTH